MKQAIIIPIYMGHKARFISLLTNLKLNSLADCSLIFIASNWKEKLFFSVVARLKKQHITVLNLENLAKRFINVSSRDLNKRLEVTAAVINLKKLLGLNACFSMGYDQAIVIDSDVIFADNFNTDKLFKVCKENFLKKVFLGVSHSDEWLSEITESSLRYLKLDKDSIKNKVYSWFFDIPYYDLIEFRNFFKYIKHLYGNDWWTHLNSLTFDHLLFQYFLVSERGWKFDDYSDVTSNIPEFLLPNEFLEINKNRDYWPSWISYKCISANPDLKKMSPNLQIYYHIDR